MGQKRHGYYDIAFLSDNGRVAKIVWQSKMLNRVMMSPLACEIMELAQIDDAGFLVKA